MQVNKYTGDVPFDLSGLKGTLRYDWKALSAVQSFLGKSLFGSLEGLTVEQMAAVLAIGFQKHNPEITTDKVMEASPPLLKVVEAIGLATSAAYFGPDNIPSEASDDKTPSAEGENRPKA